jgi:hypothetical protein
VVVVHWGCAEGGTVLAVVWAATVVVADGADGTLASDSSGPVIDGDEAWSPPQPTATRSTTIAAVPNRRITTHLHSHHPIDVTLDEKRRKSHERPRGVRHGTGYLK